MPEMEHRFLQMHDMHTRQSETGDDLYLEGYFAVFGDIYHVWDNVTESIAQGAFKDALETDDVRALWNHNTDLILGRTGAGTLELREDEKGLWGKIKINQKDSEAMNAYERIARGDVTGCSFGFLIEDEQLDVSDNGSAHWTILKIGTLYEVSPCTFPAYEATEIASRGKQLEEMKRRALVSWKLQMQEKLKQEQEEKKDA